MKTKSDPKGFIENGNEPVLQVIDEVSLKERLELAAKEELLDLEKAKKLLMNNRLAVEIKIAGRLNVSLCHNEWLLPIIDKQIQEILKALRNEENLWE